jgi:hypothetical protein
LNELLVLTSNLGIWKLVEVLRLLFLHVHFEQWASERFCKKKPSRNYLPSTILGLELKRQEVREQTVLPMSSVLVCETYALPQTDRSLASRIERRSDSPPLKLSSRGPRWQPERWSADWIPILPSNKRDTILAEEKVVGRGMWESQRFRLVPSPTFPLRQVCRQAAAAEIYMLKGVREASLWRGRLLDGNVDDLVSSLSAFRLLVTYSRT